MANVRLRPLHEDEWARFVETSNEIDEDVRGRGFGRAALLALEDEVRAQGLSHIALNVFGGNEVARGLYRSLGYVETAVWMAKDV